MNKNILKSNKPLLLIVLCLATLTSCEKFNFSKSKNKHNHNTDSFICFTDTSNLDSIYYSYNTTGLTNLTKLNCTYNCNSEVTLGLTTFGFTDNAVAVQATETNRIVNDTSRTVDVYLNCKIVYHSLCIVKEVVKEVKGCHKIKINKTANVPYTLNVHYSDYINNAIQIKTFSI